MFDQLLSGSKNLADMLRLLPGVIVQKQMSLRRMAVLYGIKLDLLVRLIKSTIEPSEFDVSPDLHYILDGYLSDFLQHPDRSQLYYYDRDPMLQHIAICRRFLSLLDGSNAVNHHR